jgi:hypothetical protein
VSWPLFLVAVVAFVLALLPTRRLFLSGWRPAPLAFYLGLLIVLGVATVFVRAGTRFVVPALLVLYVLPFIGAPEIVPRTIARMGSGRRRPPAGAVVDGTARPGDERGAGDGPPPGGDETGETEPPAPAR